MVMRSCKAWACQHCGGTHASAAYIHAFGVRTDHACSSVKGLSLLDSPLCINAEPYKTSIHARWLGTPMPVKLHLYIDGHIGFKLPAAWTIQVHIY